MGTSTSLDPDIVGAMCTGQRMRSPMLRPAAVAHRPCVAVSPTGWFLNACEAGNAVAQAVEAGAVHVFLFKDLQSVFCLQAGGSRLG